MKNVLKVRSKITLLEKYENLKNDANIAKTFNIFLKNKVSTIKIGKYKITLCNAVNDLKIWKLRLKNTYRHKFFKDKQLIKI